MKPIDLEEYEAWQQEQAEEVLLEFLDSDRLARLVKYVQFVSTSKGWRNGKQRKRRYMKEVELVRYTNGWHLSKNFKWDVYATEILGDIEDAEHKLRELVPQLCTGNQKQLKRVRSWV